MTRAYRDPIEVEVPASGVIEDERIVEDDGAPAPAKGGGRGRAYRVLATLGSWQLQDRWWETGGLGGTGAAGEEAAIPAGTGRGPSDRTYYRLHCRLVGAARDGDLLCEVYRDDAAGGAWVLERVYD